MQRILLESLRSYSEQDLTLQFLVPLVEKIRPGRVEYTHSSIEGGRDLVSFSTDALGREDVLCIQVKAEKISYGAKFAAVKHTSELAKTTGVTLENGQKVFPHEIWFLTSYPFPEQERRQVADVLIEMERNGIKFIAGEELCQLLVRNVPDLVAPLTKNKEPQIGNLIARLCVHTEGRAFGFSQDRTLDQFYVTATMALVGDLGLQALKDKVSLSDYELSVGGAARRLLEAAKIKGDQTAPERVRQMGMSALKASSHWTFIETYAVQFELTGGVSPALLPEALSRNKYVSFSVTLLLSSTLQKLVARAKKAQALCPKELEHAVDVRRFRAACLALAELERFISQAAERYNGSIDICSEIDDAAEPVRTRISKPGNIVSLGDLVLIEGPPGCGKTTLTKMLAVDLLAEGEKVFYLQCFKIPKNEKGRPLVHLAKRYSHGAGQLDWKPEQSILILDGLDEAPFPLFDLILRGRKHFSRIVASSRIAYSKERRSSFFSLTLAPFSGAERDQFFEHWFAQNPENLRIAKGLIADYRDIDGHTRLPLIATTTAALIESGFTPKTRAEIYENRLELLLSRWDRARGVARNLVENSDAKRRFLRRLAFAIHSSDGRSRTISASRMAAAFEKSLGNVGYRVSFDDILDDLVVANGVLSQEGEKHYSFGHLTFQEHLAGEYMAKHFSVEKIIPYIGDDWWKEPLNFYASILGEITDLVKELTRRESFIGNIEQLREMVRYAPYTSPGAIEVIEQTYTEVSESLRDEQAGGHAERPETTDQRPGTG